MRRWLQAAVVALILLFFGLAFYSQLPALRAYDWSLNPAYMALAFGLLVVRGPVAVYGWWATLRALGYTLPFGRAMRIAYHSALARYLPGQMWYAVSRVYLTEKEGVPRGIIVISMGLEIALMVVAALLVSTLGLSVWEDAPVWLGALVLAAVLGLVLQPRLMFAVLNRGLKLLGRQPIEVELSRGAVLRLLWPYTLNWLQYGVMSFALTAALYPGLPWSQLPTITGLFTAAWLVGFLTIIVPQGFFIREGLVFTFLTLLGIPAPAATAIAILSRFWTMLGEAIWSAITLKF